MRSNSTLPVTAILLAAVLCCRSAMAAIIGPNVGIATTLRVEVEPDLSVSQGRMVALWYRGVYRDAVGWGFSLDGGTSWTAGESLPTLSGFAGVSGLASLCADELGHFFLTASSNPPVISGQALLVWAGGFSGSTFAWQGPYQATSLESFADYDMPRIACDPSGARVYLTYTYTPDFTIRLIRSLDDGRTWSAPQTLSGPLSDGARVAVGPDGEVYVIWHDYALHQVQGRRSMDAGVTFGPVFNAGAIHDNGGVNPPGWQPHFPRQHPYGDCPGCDRFVNSPSIAIDGSPGPRRGRVYLCWAETGAGGPLPALRSVGEIEPNDFHFNATEVEVGNDFSGYLVRLIESPFSHDFDRFTFPGTAGTTLWFDGMWDSFDAPPMAQEVSTLTCGPDTLDQMLCGWNQMYKGQPSVLPIIWTVPTDDRYDIPAGGSSKSYDRNYEMRLREYAIDPGEVARDQRDVVLVSSGDGGAGWSGKVRVNDDAPRFDNSFPEVAVDAGGRVHVAWYDRREEPACGRRVQTYWTWSGDGGVTFHPSERVSEVTSGPVGPEAPWWVGDHMALKPEGDGVWVVWALTQGTSADVIGARVAADVQTGIAVADLTAEALGDRIRLAWWVEDTAELDRFRVERSQAGGLEPLTLEEIEATHRGRYEVEDISALPGVTYEYRLEALRRDGTRERLGLATARVAAPPERLRWLGASPNPSAGPVRLGLMVPEPSEADVRIYDVAGHEVATVLQGRLAAGPASWSWDGRDAAGRRAAPGVYLVRARVGHATVTQRLARMR